jgi:exopolyphosphatase/guanosine-5'-triphosphate,3'-diphosphate pyrophosphatase
MDNCKLAAIDIGTNSIHMVVVKINADLPTFSIITKEKETVRLGDRDPETNELRPEAMERSINTLKRCKQLAESFGVSHLIATATSATREAANGGLFLKMIQEQVGLEVNLISGQEEARRIYLGVLSGMDFGDRNHIVIDIGGGSTEIVLADSSAIRLLTSTKVGAVRLTQDFITTDPISAQEYDELEHYIRRMLERPIDGVLETLGPADASPLMVGTSGTIETLALLQAHHTQGAEPSILNGYVLTYKGIKSIVKSLVPLNQKQRAEMDGMPEKRSDIILAGAMILMIAMELLGLKEIVLCERALREGIIVDWMLNHGLIENRLQYQGEVRSRSVLKIAHKYQVDDDYGKRVADFTMSLFDQTKGILHNWDTNERDLLWAAAILHNCGLYISHSSHHKHSYYLIRHGELLGFNEIEIELIANMARYHRKSKPRKKHLPYANLPSKEQKIVRQLSALLRLAIAFDRRQIGAITEVDCRYNPATKQLSLMLHPAKSQDNCDLEIWTIDYKKEIFEQEYGITVKPILIPS